MANLQSGAGENGAATWSDDLKAGGTLFLAVLYSPIAVAQLLQLSKVPFEVAFSASLISIAVGCILSAYFTSTPLIVAPAVGMAALLRSVTSGNISWQQALLSFTIAGFIALFISVLPGKRRELLNSLPDEIHLGVSAGVGAILLSVAWDLITPSGQVAFAIGLFFLLLANALVEGLKPVSSMPFRRTLLFIGEIAPIVVVLSIGLLSPMGQLKPQSFEILWGAQFLDSIPENSEVTFSLFMLTVVAVFVLMTDIAGTPYELDKEEKKDNEAAFNEKVDRSFKVDSGLAIFNSIIGTVPSIYYVENHVVRHFKSTSKRAAVLVGVAFAVIAALFCISPASGAWLLNRIPTVSLAPLLAFIGLTVIARSLLTKEEQKEAEDPTEKEKPRPAASRSYYFYMPTAVMIILTPHVGFQFSLPAGIVVFWLYGLITGKMDAQKPWFIVISLLAFMVLFTGLVFIIFR